MVKPWLKYYDEGVPATIDYPAIPVDQLLSKGASNHPDQSAIIFWARVGSRLMDATLTYRQINDAANRFASSLQNLGVKKGDRVAIMAPSCPQFVIAAYATWRIGAIVVCCNPLYVEREVEHLVQDSGAETMVVLSSLYGRVKSIRSKTSLKRVIVTNIKEYFPGLLKFLFGLSNIGKVLRRVLREEELRKAG
jgi:long-chain acyl-CoA synthetase